MLSFAALFLSDPSSSPKPIPVTPEPRAVAHIAGMTTPTEGPRTQRKPIPEASGRFARPETRGPPSKEKYSYIKGWKYKLTSFHFPPNHHYQGRGAKTPWIATVSMCFHNLDLFKSKQFSWRHDVEGCSWWDKCDVSYDSHPAIDNVVMYSRDLRLEWYGDDEVKHISGEDERNNWAVYIRIWARDLGWLEDKLTESKIASLINPETRVWWEGTVIGDNNCTLSPVHLFYNKTFESPPVEQEQDHDFEIVDWGAEVGEDLKHEVFCVDVGGKKLGIDDPDLRQAVEDHFARQLFGPEEN